MLFLLRQLKMGPPSGESVSCAAAAESPRVRGIWTQFKSNRLACRWQLGHPAAFVGSQAIIPLRRQPMSGRIHHLLIVGQPCEALEIKDCHAVILEIDDTLVAQ
jgi:hypothetical protein